MEVAGIKVVLEAELADAAKGFNKINDELNKTASTAKNVTSSTDRLSKSIDSSVKPTQKLPKELKNVNTQLTAMGDRTRQASFTLQGFSRIAQDAPYGLIGIGNNIPQVLEGFDRLKQSAGGVGGALKSIGAAILGPAGVIFAISTTIAAAQALIIKYGSLGGALQAALGGFDAVTQAQRDLTKAMNEGVAGAQAEVETINALLNIARDEALTKQARQQAIDKINKDYPGYIENLNLETVNTKAVRDAVDKLNESLIRQAKIKAAQGLIEEEFKKIIKLQTNAVQDNLTALDWMAVLFKQTFGGSSQAAVGAVNKGIQRTGEELTEAEKRLELFQSTLQNLLGEEAKSGTLNIKLPEKAKAAKPIKLEKIEFLAAIKPEMPDLRSFHTKMKEFIEEVNKRPERTPIYFTAQIDPKSAPNIISPEAITNANNLKEVYDAIQLRQQMVADFVQQTMTPVFFDFFSSLAQGGKNAMQSLGESIKRMVTQLLSAVAAAAALAGIMSALGLGKFGALFGKLSPVGILPNVPKFASGGIVSGPTMAMVGEYPGARSNPEVIAPLDKLKDLIGGGGESLTATVKGSDLLFVLNRAGRSAGRI